MQLGALSTVYLIIFLPLISSLICSIVAKNKASFFLTIFCCFAVLSLTLSLFPEVILFNKISNAPTDSLSPIASEFSLDVFGLTFVLLLIFLKIINLLYNAKELSNSLNKSSNKAFYPVFLLSLFSVIGICLTDNLIIFLLFLEIYSLGFIALLSTSQDRVLQAQSSNYFSLNAATSLVIIFCSVVIFLICGEVHFDKISAALAVIPQNKSWFSALIFILFFCAIVAKFFPAQLYFSKLGSASPLSSFLAVESIFAKSLLGIFVIIKLFSLFSLTKIFQKFLFTEIITFAALSLIFYSITKLYHQKNSQEKPKLITAYFCFANIGFVLICLAFPSLETLQASFFFLLNLCLVNLAFFFYFNFLTKSETVTEGRKFLTKTSGVIITLFIVSFPMTILFFANWHFAMAFFNKSFGGLLMLVALVVTNLIYLDLGTKLLPLIFSRLTNSATLKISAGNYLRPISFWFVVVIVLALSLDPFLIGDIAIEFSHSLLPKLK